MIKILMHGCNGKMGRMITEIAKQDQDWIFKSECFSRTGTFSLNKYEISNKK